MLTSILLTTPTIPQTTTSNATQSTELIRNVPVEIALLLITIVLSGLGVYLSVRTHVFQVNTGLRESLEQLDDVLIGKNTKVRVILHHFEYSPLRTIFTRTNRKGSCVLEFRVHVLNEQNIGGAGQPEEIKHFINGMTMKNIEDYDLVTNIEQDTYWLRIDVDSIDPADCREIASKVMRRIVEFNI